MYGEAIADQVVGHARAAHEAIVSLNHATVGEPELLLPGEVATTLGHLAALAAGGRRPL